MGCHAAASKTAFVEVKGTYNWLIALLTQWLHVTIWYISGPLSSSNVLSFGPMYIYYIVTWPHWVIRHLQLD